VKGGEFLRKVKKFAKRRGLAYRWHPERGSGSHGTLYLGEGPGLLADMCKQLGIRKEDL
jgi:mRNA interferase HicA